jgi:hypothetical protein
MDANALFLDLIIGGLSSIAFGLALRDVKKIWAESEEDLFIKIRCGSYTLLLIGPYFVDQPWQTVLVAVGCLAAATCTYLRKRFN